MKAIQDWLLENGQPEKSEIHRGPSAKCIVINSKNEVLILRMADGGGFGKWDIPGGGIEEGEDAELAVKREVKEETRLKIDKPTKIKDVTIKYQSGNNNLEIKTKFYRARIEGPDDVYLDPSKSNKDPFFWNQVPRAEHSEFKWVKYQDELERLPMHDQVKEIVMKELEDRYKKADSDEQKEAEKESKKKDKEKEKQEKEKAKKEEKDAKK